MNKIIFSFITTLIAGFSTLLGVVPCFINSKYKNSIIAFTLAFSGGVMLAMSLLSLIPEAVLLLNEKFLIIPTFIICFIFVVLGILLSFGTSFEVERVVTNNKLYQLGIISIIVLMLHNIPEDCSCYVSRQKYNIGLK